MISFFDFDASHNAAKRGQLKRFTDAAGRNIDATFGGNNLISSLVQGSGGTTSGYHYDYVASGANANRLEYVTLKVDESNVRRAKYDYYVNSDSYGNDGDLKRAQIQEWNGSAWVTIATHYYRYYETTTGDGVVHGLKYVVSPLGYAAMVAGGITPETASDAVIEAYAKHYFKYNSDRSVKEEKVNAGVLSFGFTATTSGFSDGVNNWKYKTVETLPDGNRHVVYSNYRGQTILKVLQRMSGGQETTDKWYEYFQYEEGSRLTLRAGSSAVDSVSEGSAGLVTLKTSAGFIRLYEYYTSGAVGYLQYEKIKQGSSGTPLIVREYTYTARTVGSTTIYVPWKEICYPSASDQTMKLDCTIYTYTWQGSTFQIDERTTTLPAVGTSENGSGTSNTRREKFNAYGQLTWFQDERGYITGYSYGLSTGALTQTIEDASSGTPWTPVSGSHADFVTDYTVDKHGRTTEALGPQVKLDLGGSWIEVRRAEWRVYKDDTHEVWVGRGYQNRSDMNFYLINPVEITRMDGGRRVVDRIQATRASASGKLQASDSLPQSGWVKWQKNLYVASASVGAERIYFAIPSTGDGTLGTN